MLGIHVKKVSAVLEPPNRDRKSIAEAIATDCEVLGLDAAQIFTHGPRNHNRNLNASDIRELRDLTQHISVHSSYPSVALWKLTHENKNSPASKRIIGHIADQLDCSRQIGSKGLVVHISRVPTSVILEAMEVIEPISRKAGVPIWLEMISSRAHPDLTYETPKKLNKLVQDLESLDGATWGLCIDTAHIWGSGTDIADESKMEAWLAALTADARSKISLFHLNGSSSEFGSGKDKHEIAFCGADIIYSKHKATPSKSGVHQVIKFCVSQDVPVILEINRGSEADAIACVDIIADMEVSFQRDL